jgi:cytochrome b pre-mRNA-processing protein 3
MILPLFRRKQHDTIDHLYGAIVAQARHPAFYVEFGVPDTVEGRLDMIMLHVVLLLHRVTSEPEALEGLGQAVFDRFCRDMDDNLREMGVGDLAVPKQMQRIAGAFYGRARAYQTALETADPSCLAEALRRNIYGDEVAATPCAARLAAYVREALDHLHRQDYATLSAGQLRYPDPTAAVTTTSP